MLETKAKKRFRKVTDDRSFADALYGLLDEKPEKNAELIAESADMLASLAGETDEATAQSVGRVRASLADKIAAKQRADAVSANAREAEDDAKILTPKRGIRWKLLIPIAAAVALLAALTAFTFAGSTRLADLTNELWKLIAPGEKVVESDYEMDKMKEWRDYDEFEALLAEEGIEGVLAPKGVTASEPLVIEYGDYREITATFTDENGRVYDYEAQYPSQAEKINAELTRIGRFDVSLSHYDDTYQAEFISDGTWYIIGTDDPDALAAFVASLGE